MRIYTLAALLMLPIAGTAQAITPTFDVYDQAGLAAALKNAPQGGTIRLNGGSYGDLVLFRKTYANGLLITSVGAQRAKFNMVRLNEVSGVTLVGADISSAAKPVVAVGASANIRLDSLRISGATINNDPWDDLNQGLHIRMSSDVKITNSLFRDLAASLLVQRSPDVEVRENTFRHVREGINVAAASNLRIVGNFFHSFSPRFHLNEHSDNIQFWTSNETVGSSNVVIARNVMLNGGKKAIQGIFIGSETMGKPIPQIQHRDFQIYENVYYGSSLHGITASSMVNGVVRNNVVVASPWADQLGGIKTSDGLQSKGYQPGIRSSTNGSNVSLYNNVLVVRAGVHGDSRAWDNVDIIDPQERSGVSWETVVGARPTADVPPLGSFISKPGTVAASRNIGIAAPFAYGSRLPD